MASVPGGKPLPRAVLAVVVVVLALAAPTFAAAQAMPDISGVDQYVEPVPTGGGSHPAGAGGGPAGGGGGPSNPVNHAVHARIAKQAGPDAATLEAVATDPRYGAPRDTIKDSRAHKSRGAGSASGREAAGTPPDVSLGEAISSGVGSLAGDEGGRGTTGLLVALVVASLAIVALAVWRSRRRSA
ncbi:MAG: hypothetical protein M3304_01960 [Actinomycetota bacterium]|nr:hypothetical protein [Actinomycetota bacterium]